MKNDTIGVTDVSKDHLGAHRLASDSHPAFRRRMARVDHKALHPVNRGDAS